MIATPEPFVFYIVHHVMIMVSKIKVSERVTHLHIAVPTKTRFYASRIHVLKNEKNLYIYLYMNK